MGTETETVCVTGASGFIGSWLIMRLLEKGYAVRATVRDPDNMKKVKHLLELPKASTHLTLWKADLSVEGSYDEAIQGCTGVFHVATPMDFESKDPENEVIKPTINGVLDIMRACAKSKTVRKIIFTSSAGTVDVEEKRKPVYDESCWSDLDFVQGVKMTGWMYFVSKTLAEQAAWKFAEENNLDFISIIPTLVVGPFIMQSMPPSLLTALSLITGIASPTLFWFKDIDENLACVAFSSKKLTDLGFEFKYSLEDMFAGAVETCREKGLIPLSHKKQAVEECKENEVLVPAS
ncbi:hypothetical protein POTOM_007343 [Populus tomentosa]|uniref:Flavanone 4-reductase n=1 Tax=Populus tomentosa TaxID=118781 RepID=A0A8X8ACE5_POPTO|nr:hypothetical protein POTOM_007343 [Populus tomentosa]